MIRFSANTALMRSEGFSSGPDDFMLRRSSALPDQPATPCEVPVWGQCTLPRFIQALFIRKSVSLCAKHFPTA